MTNAELVEPQSETIIAKVIRHWQGKGTLAWAYWGFHFGGGLILSFLLLVGFLVVLPFAYQDGVGIQHSGVFAAYLLVAASCYLAHALFSVVMIWRCGRNTGWGGWRVLSRVQLMLWILNWLRFLWLVFAGR